MDHVGPEDEEDAAEQPPRKMVKGQPPLPATSKAQRAAGRGKAGPRGICSVGGPGCKCTFPTQTAKCLKCLVCCRGCKYHRL